MCGSILATHAQSGQRYAEPVFETVNIMEGIRFSSAVKVGESSPTDLFLDFYEPEGDTFTKRPLVITVFGGAFVAGGRDFVDMQAYCTRLAQHGYVAASIDYRLLSMWQISHTGLMRDAYMAAQDVSSAIRFLKYHGDEYKIDTSQVFLLGNSAGSIAILCDLFMDESERPAETFESPDLGPVHSSGFEEYAGVSAKVAGAIPHWGGVLDLDFISKEEYVPLCMIHGTDDTTVPYDSGYCYSSSLFGLMPYIYGSHSIANRLEAMGITDYEFHSFEGEGHSFYLDLTWLNEEKFDACFNITRDFLFRHLNFPTALHESHDLNIQVYPNPASDLLTIGFDPTMQDNVISVEVTDVSGRRMYSENASGVQATIDVSQWPSGVYFVRIKQDGAWDTYKFVKR